MKTSYLALALLSPFAVAAQTPSSTLAPPPATSSAPVTIYGTVDAGLVGEGACASACAHSKLDSGVETGAQLGALTLGRQYNLQYQVLVDVADPFKGGLAGTATNLMGYSVMRYDNSIKYVTPSSHGWSAAALYSFGESPNSSATNRAYGASLGYADGPVNVSVAHQRKDNPGDFSSGDNVVDQSASNTLVAANFKVGVATAYAAFGRDKGVGSSPWDASNPYGALVLATPSNDSRDMLAGLSLPVGATTFMASYIHKDDRSILNQDADQLAVGMTYALSRRTDFYAAVAKIHNKNGAGYTVGNATSAGHGDRAINAGIRLSF